MEKKHDYLHFFYRLRHYVKDPYYVKDPFTLHLQHLLSPCSAWLRFCICFFDLWSDLNRQNLMPSSHRHHLSAMLPDQSCLCQRHPKERELCSALFHSWAERRALTSILGQPANSKCAFLHLAQAQERSRAGRWSWALKAGWIVLLQSSSSTVASQTLSLWLCSTQPVKQQLAKYTSCFTLAWSPPSEHCSGGGEWSLWSLRVGALSQTVHALGFPFPPSPNP